MVKRMKIDLGVPVIRISKPGVDVDTATQEQLLLDERVLYAQVAASAFMNRNGSNSQSVSIPNLGFIPYLLTFPLLSSGQIVKPGGYTTGDNGILFWYTQPANTTVTFGFGPDSDAITGIYYQVLRIPRN